MADYVSLGVIQVWLVASGSETVEVLALQDGAYARTGLFGAGDIVKSTVLDGLDLAVDTIFED